MNWKKIVVLCVLMIAIERFCYYATGTFSLPKMRNCSAPPSPTSASSPIILEQPLRFLGAGKQFYAFETADGKYVVKFMKWSRRRPLPWLEFKPLKSHQQARAKRASNLLQSSHLALQTLPQETQLVIPAPPKTFTLIDKLGITHTIPSSETTFFVQKKAQAFTDFLHHHPEKAPELLSSFIRTVSSQCHHHIVNLDPVTHRNYGVIDNQVILLDIGSFLLSSRLSHEAAIHQEIVIELLPLRSWLEQNHPEHLEIFDHLLTCELKRPLI